MIPVGSAPNACPTRDRCRSSSEGLPIGLEEIHSFGWFPGIGRVRTTDTWQALAALKVLGSLGHHRFATLRDSYLL
jgi:hypothetical protein